MKNLIILCFSLVFSVSLTAQNPVKTFYQDYKRLEGVRNYKIPGWVVWLGSSIYRPFAEDAGTKVALKYARKVKKARIMVIEDGNNPLPAGAITDFVHDARQHRFDDLIYVREEGSHINVMAKVKKDKIKELVVMVDEPDEMVFIGLKTRLKVQDINKFLRDYERAQKKEAEKQLRKWLPQEDTPMQTVPDDAI